MEKSIFLAGSGGHGIQMAGKTLVQAFNTDILNATYSPRYGVEKRGGLSSCYLVISDGQIGNPRKPKNDLVVLMEPKCYEQFKDTVKPDGILVVNSTIIKEHLPPPEGTRRLDIPLTGAAQELGNPKVISSLLLGLLSGIPGLIRNPANVKAFMLKMLEKKPELMELNNKAFDKGMELAEAAICKR